MTTLDSIDLDLRIAEFKINGYVVLEDMLHEETIDRVREAFLPLLQHVKERETEESGHEVGDVRTGKGSCRTAPGTACGRSAACSAPERPPTRSGTLVCSGSGRGPPARQPARPRSMCQRPRIGQGNRYKDPHS